MTPQAPCALETLKRLSSRAPSTTLRAAGASAPDPPLLGPDPVHARLRSATARPVAQRPAQRPAPPLTIAPRCALCSCHRVRLRHAPQAGRARRRTIELDRPARAAPRPRPARRRRAVAGPPRRRPVGLLSVPRGLALASCTPSTMVDMMVGLIGFLAWLNLATPALVGCAPELYEVMGAFFLLRRCSKHRAIYLLCGKRKAGSPGGELLLKLGISEQNC